MFNRIMIAAVQAVSVFFRVLGWRACRFHPTCSEYAKAAFETMSGFAALKCTLSRILRCHPFCTGGYDPLPKITKARG